MPKIDRFLTLKSGFNGIIHTIDASGIAISTIGLNKPNTPMLGALIKVTDIVPLEANHVL